MGGRYRMRICHDHGRGVYSARKGTQMTSVENRHKNPYINFLNACSPFLLLPRRVLLLVVFPLVLSVVCLILISSGARAGDHRHRIPGDINGDGNVSFADFVILAQNFGRQGGAEFNPSAGPDTVRIVTTEVIPDTIISRKLYPKITVFGEAEDWNGMPVDFVQHICQTTYDIFTEHIYEPFDSDIFILPSEDRSSRLLYTGRASGGQQIMFLARIGTENHLPFIQHFTHEYVHSLGKHWKAPSEHRQMWLQESIAQTAALFMMYHLQTRLARPNNWLVWGERNKEWDFSDSSGQLHRAGSRIHDQLQRKSYEWDFYGRRQTPQGFENWFYENKSVLENAEQGNAAMYIQYSHIAHNLVDIFQDEHTPQGVVESEAWNILDYMCPYGPYYHSSNQSLEDYFRGWWLRTPQRWQRYVAEIASRFGIDVVMHRP